MLLILALAVISGLGAGYSALQYMSERSTPLVTAGDRETLPVVLASADLPVGRVLQTGDVRVVDWPAGSIPTGFASAAEEVTGRSLISAVQANEPILATKLADSGLLGLIPLIEPGMRAMTVRVDDVVGVAGFVGPKTRVDVILIMTPPGEREPLSKVILQNIEAVAAETNIEPTEDGTAVIVTSVTVLVTPEEAEKLALASQEGEIRMALRNTLDVEAVETSGERVSRLFSGAGGVRGGRPLVRTGSTAATSRESIIEIYRGGVRTLVSY
jgi:pilus assembly protein CpaB